MTSEQRSSLTQTQTATRVCSFSQDEEDDGDYVEEEEDDEEEEEDGGLCFKSSAVIQSCFLLKGLTLYVQ